MSDSCPTHPHTDGSTMVGTKMLLMMKLLMMLLMLVRLTMMRRGAVSLDHAPWPAPQDLGRVGEDVTALQSAFDEVRPSFFVRVRCITDSSDNLSKSRILCSLLGSLPRVLHLTEGVWTICVGCTSLLLRSNASSGLFARIG